MLNSTDIRKLCNENGIRMIDFKMTDLDGRWRHITIPVERFNDDIFVYGIGFDGSNYGYAPVEKSDMVFIPVLTLLWLTHLQKFLHSACVEMSM